jgi:hypothetical protein
MTAMRVDEASPGQTGREETAGTGASRLLLPSLRQCRYLTVVKSVVDFSGGDYPDSRVIAMEIAIL